MSDMRTLLVDMAARLFNNLCTSERFALAEQGGFDRALWDALEAAELTRATVSEARGGSGADLGDALAVVRVAGRYCLPAPLAETLLSELMLAHAGLTPRSGVVTIGPVLTNDALELSRSGGRWELSGTLHRVPWARHADTIAVIARSQDQWITAIADAPKPIAEDRNWANEPRDTVLFDKLPLADDAVGKLGQSLNPEQLKFKGALFRLAAMAGALTKVMHMSVQYAKDRIQFGRPIGQFQAVQQQLAVLATQVAAASAAAEMACDAANRGEAPFEIAAAKARVGEAAHIVANIAHQVHGAIGFAQEYALQRSTRRLWSWRDEFGSETEWAGWVGRIAARVGGEQLWPFLASDPKQLPS